MSNLMSDLFYTYISLFRVSIILGCCMLWFSLSNVDRIHLREKSRRIGLKCSNYLLKILAKESTYNKFRLILIRPLCVLLEICIGFLEGLEKLEPIIILSDNNNKYLEIDDENKNCDEYIDINNNLNNKILDKNIVTKLSDDNKSEDLCNEIKNNNIVTKLSDDNKSSSKSLFKKTNKEHNKKNSKNENNMKYKAKKRKKVSIRLARRRHQY